MDRLLALRRQGLPDFESSLPPRFMDRILDRMKKSSNRRGISRRRLERCSSSFAEALPASTSSFVTRSLELPNSTSFRLFGPGDGEFSKKLRLSSNPINRFQPRADVLSEVSSSGDDSLVRDNTAICSGGVADVSQNASEIECGRSNGHDDDKENLFEKCLTTVDVGNLDRLVVTVNEDVGKYFLLATVIAGTDSLLRLEDEEGKTWLFGFSYLNVSQCCEFTKGWRSYVEEKQLKAGDFVFFRRYSKDSSKLLIGCRKSDESFPSVGMQSLYQEPIYLDEQQQQQQASSSSAEMVFIPPTSDDNVVTGLNGNLSNDLSFHGGGLSLSLGNQIQYHYQNLSNTLGYNPSLSDENGKSLSHHHHVPSSGYETTGSVSSVVLRSPYLKPTQQLLDEVVSVRKLSDSNKKTKNNDKGQDFTTDNNAEELSSSERQELQSKKNKLLTLVNEVDKRYNQYHHQMEALSSSFEVVAGLGASKPYTSVALNRISRHFRCLRDALKEQVQVIRGKLGEKETSEEQGERIPRLRYLDQRLRQHRALHQQLGMVRPSWGPQRGLPENSVSVLRAWLFEHFLHPYPKESEKIMLGKQTGLTKNQVANWFINARVRLWKPMTEKMYKEEFGDSSELLSNSNQDNSNKMLKHEDSSSSQQENTSDADRVTSGDYDSLINYHHQGFGVDDYKIKELKEAETSFQPKLAELTGSDPILVIYCGDNQISEEIYLISYIFNELCLRGFVPLRYDIKMSTVTENQKMLHISRVGVIIFSMNFAHSRECMDGFVAIMDHLKANDLVLIPVFFKVSVSEVRGQSGSFRKAFTRLGSSVHAYQVLKWREAMIELTSINGYQYVKGDEIKLAKNIVRDVCLPLSSETNIKLRGTRLSLKSILSLLHRSQPSAPQIVGLWGMAGIGKTTIMRDFFRSQAERYDVCYFLPDCHLMCQTKGLSCLRDEFFSKIFGAEKVFIDACDTKVRFTRDRFLGKKVLIVLDGVSSAKDAEVLVGGFGWFSGGHTIILTSRNRQVLVQCNTKEIYEIEKLSKPESFHLCSKFATKENWKGRMSLISELVDYASGNPLALRVLGTSIQKQFINDEKQHLRRLRQHPPIEIQNAFRISFSGRNDDEKSIFLDLACFFRGEDKDRVVNILDGCGFFTHLGIYGLIDESLISLEDNKIEMPNIFQDAGRFVVCQEHEEAGKRSRLWDSSDIADVLTHSTGTEAIEGIFLDASSLSFDLSSTAFERMYRLRLLKLHCPTSENHCQVCLPEGLHSLPDELRLLHWESYPLKSLPRNFNPKNLVELNMPYSNLTKVWKGTKCCNKNLEKLKRIILSHSQQLTKFPRLAKARNLEHIDLEGCTSLVKVNSSIIHHHKLTFLSLKNCSRLRVMPTTVHLKSLEVLNLSGCSELENLQDFSSNLKELYLAGTAIREMPSIGDLTRLITLDLENCEHLQHLPPGISNLKAMMTLKLSGCSNLKSLPVLDALFLQDSQRPNTRVTMEESVSINLHSGFQESRLDGSETLLNLDNLQLNSDIHGSCFSREAVEELLPTFDCLSNNEISQERWTRVTAIPFPSSILHSLASRLYALVSLFLCNANLVDIPEDICWLASVMRLDFGGNSFSQIPKSIKEFRKLHSLRLRHCKNLKSLPELPRSLVILNAHGCVSLKSFPSSFEQFPRHYTFSNCFNLSPKVVKKYIGKALNSVKGMAKGILLASLEQEHISSPAFSICIPASAGHQSSVNLQAGSCVRIQLAPGMLKTLSGFALSVVVDFWDSYSNTAGFAIKCICRKSRPDLSPRLERIFQCWAPKEPTTVKRDHMFVFGSVKMQHAEAINHDFLSDSVTFEFRPVNWENQLLSDTCTVKRCGVYLITDAPCNTALSAKRPSSSMDSGGLSSMEHVAPPSKRCRLKGVIEIVILSLRKRKREMSVPTVKSFSKVKRLCRSYVRTGNCAVGPICSFDHPPWVLTHKTASSIPSKSSRMDMQDKRVETSTEKPKRLSVSESSQATSSKDITDTEQEKV